MICIVYFAPFFYFVNFFKNFFLLKFNLFLYTKPYFKILRNKKYYEKILIYKNKITAIYSNYFPVIYLSDCKISE